MRRPRIDQVVPLVKEVGDLALEGCGLGSTWSVGILGLRNDYVYSSAGMTASEAHLVDCACEGGRSCSDHRGVAVEFRRESGVTERPAVDT